MTNELTCAQLIQKRNKYRKDITIFESKVQKRPHKSINSYPKPRKQLWPDVPVI
jgi:hypothetical protein